MTTASSPIHDGPFFVPGFALGHWTHPDGATGCSVLRASALCPAAVEVRGGAPGSRETSLLESGRTVQAADAILLTGGSVFGLSAAEGIMDWLRERGRGVPTSSINVPIVSGAVIFDLKGNDPVWPASLAGYEAVDSASEAWTAGKIGAGAGASVSKGAGREYSVPSGSGIAQVRTHAGTASAFFVNNAVGDVVDDRTGRLLTRPTSGNESSEELLLRRESSTRVGENTVIGAIVVDRPMDHDSLVRLVIAGHTGISRAIRPAHTVADGDTVFALAPEAGECSSSDLLTLATAAQVATARALVNSVSSG